jgi:alpha-beta hydrolase superfamily lysophospholipase
LNYEDLSRDRNFIESFKSDTLIHRKVSVGLYLQCSKAAQRLLKNPQVLQTPTLLVHGTGDKVTSHLGSRQFADAAPTDLLTYVEIPDGRHVLLQDDCKAEVWLTIDTWLSQLNF